MFSDPFEKKDNYMIHVRIHQRNGRKSTTTIEGIPTDLDLKKLYDIYERCIIQMEPSMKKKM